MEGKRFIYLDHAATTPARPEVVEAMLPYFTESFGNPSSVYTFSQKNKAKITECRELIAKTLGAKSNEIYFTAGGSESDNWALKATAEAYAEKGSISLQQRLNITQFFIQLSIWKAEDLKSHIWMWTRMV